MSAYVASGEETTMICSYDKRPGKALKKAAKLIDKICSKDEYANLVALNVYSDDENVYNVTAIISTMRH